jgi:hypothetical protein
MMRKPAKSLRRQDHRASGFRLAGEWGIAESELPALPEKKPDVV